MAEPKQDKVPVHTASSMEGQRCFVCAKKCEQEEDDEDFEIKRKVFILSRYLNLDVIEMISEGRWHVALCEDCELIMDKFTRFHQDLEISWMRLNACLQQIQTLMLVAEVEEEGGDNRSEDGSHGNDIQSLRSQAIEKCNMKLRRYQPKVRIRKMRFIASSDSIATTVPEKGPPPRPSIRKLSRLFEKWRRDSSVKLPDSVVKERTDSPCPSPEPPENSIVTSDSDEDFEPVEVNAITPPSSLKGIESVTNVIPARNSRPARGGKVKGEFDFIFKTNESKLSGNTKRNMYFCKLCKCKVSHRFHHVKTKHPEAIKSLSEDRSRGQVKSDETISGNGSSVKSETNHLVKSNNDLLTPGDSFPADFNRSYKDEEKDNNEFENLGSDADHQSNSDIFISLGKKELENGNRQEYYLCMKCEPPTPVSNTIQHLRAHHKDIAEPKSHVDRKKRKGPLHSKLGFQRKVNKFTSSKSRPLPPYLKEVGITEKWGQRWSVIYCSICRIQFPRNNLFGHKAKHSKLSLATKLVGGRRGRPRQAHKNPAEEDKESASQNHDEALHNSAAGGETENDMETEKDPSKEKNSSDDDYEPPSNPRKKSKLDGKMDGLVFKRTFLCKQRLPNGKIVSKYRYYCEICNASFGNPYKHRKSVFHREKVHGDRIQDYSSGQGRVRSQKRKRAEALPPHITWTGRRVEKWGYNVRQYYCSGCKKEFPSNYVAQHREHYKKSDVDTGSQHKTVSEKNTEVSSPPPSTPMGNERKSSETKFSKRSSTVTPGLKRKRSKLGAIPDHITWSGKRVMAYGMNLRQYYCSGCKREFLGNDLSGHRNHWKKLALDADSKSAENASGASDATVSMETEGPPEMPKIHSPNESGNVTSETEVESDDEKLMSVVNVSVDESRNDSEAIPIIMEDSLASTEELDSCLESRNINVGTEQFIDEMSRSPSSTDVNVPSPREVDTDEMSTVNVDEFGVIVDDGNNETETIVDTNEDSLASIEEPNPSPVVDSGSIMTDETEQFMDTEIDFDQICNDAIEVKPFLGNSERVGGDDES